MAQHFLLSARAKTLSLATIFRMSDTDAEATFRKVRWPDTDGAAVCPECGGVEPYEFRRASGALRFECKACRHEFSITSGTLFASHKLPLRTYLAAIAVFCNEVKGKSALAISRDLGVSYKACFVLLHKLREAMAEEMKGRPVSALLPSHQLEELTDIYSQLKRGEWIARYESERLTKQGEKIDVSLTLSPIKDAAGNVMGVSSIERDITIVKREEEERLKLIEELTEALRNIKTLRGLLPICASCKKIRDDRGYWQKVESYIAEHTNAAFTHGLCPDCLDKLYPEKQLGR